MKKKILVIGPLGDFGGRELEAVFIAQTLANDYDVNIFSTGNLTHESQVFDFVSSGQVMVLNQLIFNTSIWFRVLAYFSFFKSGRKQNISNYVSNSLSKKTGYRNYALSSIKKEVDKSDVIIICAQISSNYIGEIVEYCHFKNIPTIFRTSNTIKNTDVQHKHWLAKVSLFVHHSLSNANQLSFLKPNPYVLIDQCTFMEDQMLKIEPATHFKSLLYIGRLSAEKGILELIDAFKSSKSDLSLKIIGDGELSQSVNDVVQQEKNIELLGYLNQEEIIEHIRFSDAIVIPSHEESGPLVGLEAMASARLAISTQVGAMPFRLENSKNQFWFNINEPNSFVTVIKKLKKLKPDEIQFIAEENRTTYLKKYRKSQIEAEYKNAISTVLNTTDDG